MTVSDERQDISRCKFFNAGFEQILNFVFGVGRKSPLIGMTVL